MPEPITPTTPEAEAPKVTFDDLQKARINEIVADATRRAGTEARQEAKRLQDELDALRRTQTPPPADNVTVELATTKAELAALRTAQQEATIKDALRAALADDFADVELCSQVLRQSIKVVGGVPTVIDQAGNQRLGADYNPLSLKALCQELAVSKPYLARSSMRGGCGSTPTITQGSTAPKLAEYFGKNATRIGELHRLSKLDPARYRQMRAQAQAAGLV